MVVKKVYFCSYSNAFTLTHNCRAILSKPILQHIMIKIRDIADEVSPKRGSLQDKGTKQEIPCGLYVIKEEEVNDSLILSKLCQKVE